jgi:hypothetical protein
MSEAIFALAGTLIGVLGTLLVDQSRARTERQQARRDALRDVCADYVAAIANMRNYAIDVTKNPRNAKAVTAMREAHNEARTQYERLRLTADSVAVQKSGRHVLRYAYGLMRLTESRAPRADEREQGPLLMLQDALMELYAEVRREIGLPHANDVYREPEDWVGPTGWDATGRAGSS